MSKVNSNVALVKSVVLIVKNYKVSVKDESLCGNILEELSNAINQGIIKPRENTDGSVEFINDTLVFVKRA